MNSPRVVDTENTGGENMKVPMQKQKVRKRNNGKSLTVAPHPVRSVDRNLQILKQGLGHLDGSLRDGLDKSPLLAFPFLFGLLAFIFLLGLLSPLIAPGRDFRLPDQNLSFPQDARVDSFLLNTADLDKVLTDGSVSVPAAPELPQEQPVVKLQTTTYTVKAGESISAIANRNNITLSTLISFNNITNVRKINSGTELVIPNGDGVLYTVRKGDSLSSIARGNNVAYEKILDANGLGTPVVSVGQKLYLPGVPLSAWELKQALGELFIYPTRGYISSRFGYRMDPFTGIRSFHNGVDIANAKNTPIRAAMEGRVSDTGFNSSYGNYVIIDHGNGFQTLYGHMSSFVVNPGMHVNQGQLIGLMGSTGYSTGNHCHFSIFKWNRPLDPLNYLY